MVSVGRSALHGGVRKVGARLHSVEASAIGLTHLAPGNNVLICITERVQIMSARKLITISLPPPLVKKAEELAREENRTKSELLREALRFYVATKDVRKVAARERLLAVLDQAQTRTADVPSRQIRKVVGEAIDAVRRRKRRASA